MFRSECGMVFSTKPFSSSGEQRQCSLIAGHDGAHDAEKEIVRNPFQRRRLGMMQDSLPVKEFR
jgi:hypothetical protein